MYARSKILGVLLMALFVIRTSAVAEERVSNREAQEMVAVLEYVIGDYTEAVPLEGGKIANETEFAEFLALMEKLKDGAKSVGLDQKHEVWDALIRLEEAVRRKAPFSEVASLANLAKREIGKIYAIPTYPEKMPNLKNGAELFKVACIPCHGADGRADTPAAKKLNPSPRVFADGKVMATLSPFRAYNAVTFGILHTGMSSFPTFTDSERWDVASFVFTLRSDLPPPDLNAGAAYIPWQVASSLSNGEIVRRFEAAGSTPAQALQNLSQIRHLHYPEESPIAGVLSVARRLNPVRPFWSSFSFAFCEWFLAILLLLLMYRRYGESPIVVHLSWASGIFVTLLAWIAVRGVLTSAIRIWIESSISAAAFFLLLVVGARLHIKRAFEHWMDRVLLVAVFLAISRALFETLIFLWGLRLNFDDRGGRIALGAAVGIFTLVAAGIFVRGRLERSLHLSTPRMAGATLLFASIGFLADALVKLFG